VGEMNQCRKELDYERVVLVYTTEVGREGQKEY
jgi:hypothetical protein